MTRKQHFTIFVVLLFASLLWAHDTLASWYAGSERIPIADGVTAEISTPNDPLNLVKTDSSCVYNWVSTYNSDASGSDWLQAGWAYYHWDSTPKQYVEWCIDCSGDQGTYEMHNQFANQPWGTTVDFWVSRDTGARWCAYTDGYVRYCVDDLYNGSMEVFAKSEVHASPQNPLDTNFNSVRYKDPTSGWWRLFDDQRVWIRDFPYDVETFSDSHFRTYRVQTTETFLPLVIFNK